MARWLRSGRAIRLFSYSAWIMIGVGVFFIFMMTPWFEAATHLRGGELAMRLLGGNLGVLGAPAALIIWVGMLWFCLTQDLSNRSAKILWCSAFLVGASFASAIYFFMVYRRQLYKPLAMDYAPIVDSER